MKIDFKFSPGDIVRMRIDVSKTPYMVLSMTHDNGGNYYKVYDGVNEEMIRAEFELIKYSKSDERKAGFRGKGYKDLSGNGVDVEE